MKVEIDFPTEFAGKEPLALPIGRLFLGDHIARLVFTPTGKMVLAVDREAVEDGSIILFDRPGNQSFFSP